MPQVAWVGSPNHYPTRNGYTVTHITLHIMVGRLAGTDSVFQRPGGASAHYGIGANGQVHQYVGENQGAWSDANYVSNNSTISIEHEGGMIGVPCTQTCMDTSASLIADIARRYGWSSVWHDGLKGNIWLHREIPGTDHFGCPDRAPNPLNVQYVIDKANQLLQGGNDMTTAQEVWDYPIAQDATPGLNNLPAWNRLSGIHHDTAALFKLLWRHDDVAGDGYNGDIYTRVAFIDKRVRELVPTINAQSAAIEALAKSIGADPETIANVVRDEVQKKLDALQISITATPKGDAANANA